MVHIPFDTRSVIYDDYIYRLDQEGSGHPITSDHSYYEPYTYFRGNTFQRGYGRQTGAGMGDILRHLWRMLLPVARRAGKAVAKETLNTGERILEKLDKGENIKDAVVGEGKRGMDNLLAKSGMPKQFGTGKKRIKRRRKKGSIPIPTHHTIIGKSVNLSPQNQIPRKRQRRDTFGLY